MRATRPYQSLQFNLNNGPPQRYKLKRQRPSHAFPVQLSLRFQNVTIITIGSRDGEPPCCQIRDFARRGSVMNITNGFWRRWRVFTRVGLLLVSCQGLAVGQPLGHRDVTTQWLTGKDLDRSMRFAESGDFNGSTLRQSLMEFGKRRKIAIFLDRRADPTRKLEIAMVDLTAEQFLWRIADSCELAVCRVGDVYYVGPETTASVLPLLLDESKSKSSSRKHRGDGPDWRDNEKWVSPELSEPRQLIEQLAQQNQFKIINPELIPHDLWPAIDLPELALQERLALMLVGFELWFEQTAPGEIKLIPLPNVDRGSRVVTNVDEPAKLARELRSEFANCTFTGRGNSVKITGPVDEMNRSVKWLVEHQQVEQGDPALSRYSLDTTASRGGILSTIARQMGLKLAFDPESKPILDERVTIKMSEQPIAAIVAEVLKGTNASFSFEGGQLTITMNQ